MHTTIHDDPTLALRAQRAALAAEDARAREARLAAARQDEEARFAGAERIAATFGRFLRRQPARPGAEPALLPRRVERAEADSSQRRDAA